MIRSYLLHIGAKVELLVVLCIIALLFGLVKHKKGKATHLQLSEQVDGYYSRAITDYAASELLSPYSMCREKQCLNILKIRERLTPARGCPDYNIHYIL